MKRLIIVRHAKSSWEDFTLKDIDRPLNKRGIQAANLMGHFLKKKNFKDVLFVASPANRAFSTAKIIHDVLECNEPIQINPELYTFTDDGSVFLKNLHTVQEYIKTVFLFSHNETCYHFVHALSERKVERFPTAAAASFLVDSPHWKNTTRYNLKIEFCQFPKEL